MELLIGHDGIDTLIALGQVVFINVVLSADNAVVIGMAAMGLAAKDRLRVLYLGIALATLLRIGFAVLATRLLKVLGLPLAGGVLLLWVAWKLWRELRTRRDSNDAGVVEALETKTMRRALWQIVVADLSMSLDNVTGGGRGGDRSAGDHGGGTGALGAADGRRRGGRRAAARAPSLDRLCRAGDHRVRRGEDGLARGSGYCCRDGSVVKIQQWQLNGFCAILTGTNPDLQGHGAFYPTGTVRRRAARQTGIYR